MVAFWIVGVIVVFAVIKGSCDKGIEGVNTFFMMAGAIIVAFVFWRLGHPAQKKKRR